MPVTTTGMVTGLTALRGATGYHQRPSLRSDRGHHARSATAVNPLRGVLRYAPVLRMTAAADRAGSPCGPAGRLALDRLPASATPAIRSSVAEHRRHPPDGITCAFPAASDGQGIQTPRATAADPAHVAVVSTRCGSKQAPLRSIAQATLSRRSATERRARACPWPRARSDRYLSWLTGSRWAATRAQW